MRRNQANYHRFMEISCAVDATSDKWNTCDANATNSANERVGKSCFADNNLNRQERWYAVYEEVFLDTWDMYQD